MWRNSILNDVDYNALVDNFNILKYVSPTGWIITIREKEVEWWDEYQKVTQNQIEEDEDVVLLTDKIDDYKEDPGKSHLTKQDSSSAGTKIDFPEMPYRGAE